MKIQIVGGPRDGELVDYQGLEYHEPVRRANQRGWHRDGLAPLPYERTQTRCYDLCSWSDDYGLIAPRYVLRDIAKGLGAK